MGTRISSPQFIGRERELARLADALAAAADGRPSLVIVAGEAGIGKTRLIAEATEAATAGGALVLVGGTVDLGDTPLPFGPIVEALRSCFRVVGQTVVADLVDGTSMEVLARLLPEIAPSAEASPVSVFRPEWLQARTFEAIFALLARLGERQPVVLVIDDLHWADRSTRDLIAFLVRNVRDQRLLMVATFRSDELHRRHPLVPWLAELERQGDVERLDLERFDREEQAAQLGAILGHLPAAALVGEIHGRSDGNPFFAEELLGVSTAKSEGHALRTGRGHLPGTVGDVLLARIATLSDATQVLLGVASVVGSAVEHDLLVEIAETDEREVEEALREAVGRHVLVAEHTPVPGCRFRHALAREAVYEDLLPSERRRLHARCATALAARPVPPGADGARHLAKLAHHWTNAHVQKQALATSIEAADAARATFAFAEAGHLYERAIELWEVVDSEERPPGVDVVDLLTRAAVVLDLAGDFGRAVDFGRRAVERQDAVGDHRQRALARVRLGRFEWHAYDLAGATATYEEAVQLVTGDASSEERAEALAGLAAMLMGQGQADRAVALAGEAIDAAVTVGARLIEARARRVKGNAVALLGECEASIGLLREALAIAQDVGDPGDIGGIYSDLAATLALSGDSERAIATYRDGAEIMRRLGAWRVYGVVYECGLATELIETGRWDEAVHVLARVEPHLSPGIVEGIHDQNAVALRVRRGDVEARALIDKNLAALERMPAPQFTGAFYQALVELELYSDRPGLAAADAAEAIRQLSQRDYREGLITLLAFGLAAEAASAAVARAQRDDAAGASARANADRYAAQLDSLSTSRVATLPTVRPFLAWGAAERQRIDGPPDPEGWADVKEAWSAANRPFYAAYAAFREAEAALEARRPRVEAEGPLRFASEIATRLGARPLLRWIEGLARRARINLGDPAVAPTPRAATSAEEPGNAVEAALDRYGLTPREREILGLIAGGWTNRRIADALFISESTAGVHVSNIIGKLGVVNRVEAASLAARLGVEPPDATDPAPSSRPGGGT